MRRWLAAAAKGDEDAFAALYHVFVPRIYGYLRVRITHDGDMQEVMQDIFVTIWRAAKNYAGSSTVSTWVFGIARHKVLDWLRTREKYTQLDVEWLDGIDQAAAFAEQDFSESVVRELSIASALATLPPHYAELFYLVFVESMSYKEIGMLLGVQEGTVKSRMHQVKIQLRRQLAEGGNAHG